MAPLNLQKGTQANQRLSMPLGTKLLSSGKWVKRLIGYRVLSPESLERGKVVVMKSEILIPMTLAQIMCTNLLLHKWSPFLLQTLNWKITRLEREFSPFTLGLRLSIELTLSEW